LPLLRLQAAAALARLPKSDRFDVILTGDGKKINVAGKSAPSPAWAWAKPRRSSKALQAVKEGVNKDEAEKIKKQIEEAGGTVELK
jgi:large subunit ribosomal protein L7/L12